ncbi:hypothetical protein BDV25DRAFT_148265 [Aspergillus avenaceus]|uniref:Aminoglycoside phosphotransferase domain-containing protein n=1 Tax=Aspergillus avenaceus TaxID=36643 RepID=A0A5N6U636_ASPAV|nr:hypothetical protein BDV25DRAFT_148265 [Aspergillus avenaceus]
MTTQPGRGWFGSKWLKQTIHFADLPSSWRIVQKLQEQETIFLQDDYRSSGLYSESIGIFLCEEIGTSTPAIMKIRMQVPNTVDDPSSSRTFIQPPEKDICGRTSQEIDALMALTKAECSCTPKYFASKHTNQTPDDWVPGGFLDYIVMEKMEGVTLSEEYLRELSQREQQELRNAFKSSYLECQERRFYHLDASLSNLIWNKQKMKCYIVDWEARVRKAYSWDDEEYLRWGLL